MNKKAFVYILLAAFISKLILAYAVELNNDEVYYWTYAQMLQWNYFDHPPGIAILLRIFTVNGLLQQQFFLRLGPVVCAAVSTWLVYLIGKKIKDVNTGRLAAVLFAASPYCGFIAGWLVIPDAPQLMFWLTAILLILNIIDDNTPKQKTALQFIALGITTGCCILCKVHGIFIWLGFLAYIIFCQRGLLRNVYLYCAMLVCAVFISPIFLWNLANNFISYRYHSERVSFFSTIQPDSFFREISGEILYNNPFIFFAIVAAILALIKKRNIITIPNQKLLVFIAAPLILLVLFMAVFRDTLPHWTGPAYATLIPIAAAYLVNRQPVKNWAVPPVAKWAIGFTAVLLIIAAIAINAYPGPIGKKDEQHLGDGDFTLDMSGFAKFGQAFDSLYQTDLHQQTVKANAVVFSDFWFPAAHIEYYAAKPAGLHLMAIGDLSAIHHYAWLNAARPAPKAGTDGYFITISNYYHPVPAALLQAFDKVLPPATITQYRGGQPVRHFFVYRLINYKGQLPANGVVE